MFLLILALLSSLLGKFIIHFCNNFTIATQIIWLQIYFFHFPYLYLGMAVKRNYLWLDQKRIIKIKWFF